MGFSNIYLSRYKREVLMEIYVNWVKTNPLLSAFIQFAVLGTLGEFISISIKQKKIGPIGNWWQTLSKVLAWGILGIIIKYGFVGIKGAVRALISNGLFPGIFKDGLGWAFSVSVATNLFFGPQMMFFHRLEENIIHWKWDLKGLVAAFKTLIWFWIPAHTVTFILPVNYQIGLAAIWSIALGIILGITLPRNKN